jgi:hypothetical protein
LPSIPKRAAACAATEAADGGASPCDAMAALSLACGGGVCGEQVGRQKLGTALCERRPVNESGAGGAVLPSSAALAGLQVQNSELPCARASLQRTPPNSPPPPQPALRSHVPHRRLVHLHSKRREAEGPHDLSGCVRCFSLSSLPRRRAAGNARWMADGCCRACERAGRRLAPHPRPPGAAAARSAARRRRARLCAHSTNPRPFSRTHPSQMAAS